MKSSIKKSTYKAIYRLLDKVSPIDGDCGKLCGSICCLCDADTSYEDPCDFEMGIYLLPGEEKLFSPDDSWLTWSLQKSDYFDFPDSWHGDVHFIKCNTPPSCPRHRRPLQCRFYPIAPHIDRKGQLRMILSTADLPYKCPLIEKSITLNPSFTQACQTVWNHLTKDPLIEDLVKLDSADRYASDKKITYLT